MAKAHIGTQIHHGQSSEHCELYNRERRYEGSFYDSQRHGYGEYFFADGSCVHPSCYSFLDMCSGTIKANISKE